MSDNFMDAFNSIKKMVDSGNIPSDVQNLVNNLQSNSNTSQADLTNMMNQISPEMLNNLSSMLQSNNSGSGNNSSSSNDSTVSNFNIDMNTMLKMKTIISSMNQKNDPRANLLYSLKPYLRDSKKNKLDQYVNLLNMTKVAEIMKNDNKEKNNNA